MNKFLIAISAAMILLLTGCAHPIMITPDAAKLTAKPESRVIEKNAAYYISPANRALEVNTPGGGGDSVKYQPYKELETGLYKVLTNVFKDVTVLNTEQDTATINAKSIQLIFKPTITTTSSSPSALTWPPTKFSVTIDCIATDKNGAKIMQKSVTGEGAAEFAEFKSDVSLAAKRASENALMKLQDMLMDAPELK